MQDFTPGQIEEAIGKALKRPSIPPKLKTSLETLPEGPGVYIFYGNNKHSEALQQFNNLAMEQSSNSFPLYIGKSKNLRERIFSHFSANLRSPIEMKISQQVVSIETISTAGELGALILESQMIKKMLPLYNKKSRLKHELIALKKATNNEDYNTVKMEVAQLDVIARPRSGEAIPSNLDSLLGIFKSRRQAKTYLSEIAKKYELCGKLLGLEKTNKACFAYRLGRCKGACTGAEKPVRYNKNSYRHLSLQK